jgi:hypothetical protein
VPSSQQPTSPPPKAGRSAPRAAPAAVRQLLDALVQSATVELFQSWGIAVAPLPPLAGGAPRPHRHELVGLVTLSAHELDGSLRLSADDSVFGLFASPVEAGSVPARDLLRELTNQLSGRVKNRLLNFALTLSIGVATVLSKQALEQQRPPRDTQVAYPFRTLRGEVLVVLDLPVDGAALDYSSSARAAKEGDFIAF